MSPATTRGRDGAQGRISPEIRLDPRPVLARRDPTPKSKRLPVMASPAQIAANQDVTRGAQHGPVHAEHRGDPLQRPQARPLRPRTRHPPRRAAREEFDAERDAWFGDWQPITHTRAVLVERCAVAHWKLEAAARRSGSRRPGSPRRPRTSPTRSRPSGTTPSRGGCTCWRTCRPRRPTDSVATSAAWSGSSSSGGRSAGPRSRAGRRARTITTACSTCWATRPARSPRGSSRRRWRAPVPHPGRAASPATRRGPNLFHAWDEAAASPSPAPRSGSCCWPTTGPAETRARKSSERWPRPGRGSAASAASVRRSSARCGRSTGTMRS